MPGKNERWARANLSGRNGAATIRLEVGGHSLPVSHLVLQYGLNQIPQAAVFVPLGASATTWEPSPAYAAVKDLMAFTPATLKLFGDLGDAAVVGEGTGTRKQFPSHRNPDDPAVLFTGFVRGVVYRRVHGQLGLIVNLSNQLIALTLSSAGSGAFIPGSPEDLFAPVYQGDPGETYGTANLQFMREVVYGAESDFSAAVLACVEKLAKKTLIQTGELDKLCNWPKISAGSNSNVMALKALLADGPYWNGIANLAFKSTPYPLKLPAAGALVAAYIGQRFSQSLASTHLWGMLAYAVIADFGMAIMPAARTAYLAPLLKTAKEPAYSIYPDEYADVTMTAGSLLPLYGVAVVRQQPMGTMNVSRQVNTACIGSMFTRGKTGVNKGGMLDPVDGPWMFVRAPAWLDNWALGVLDNTTPAAVANAVLSGPSTENSGGVQDTVPTPDTIQPMALTQMLKLFAQMRYIENLYRGREGTVVGKLRFDIAPGTLLRVVGRSQSAQQPRTNKGDALDSSEAKDTLATDIIGCVSQVTITINAQQPTAATSFRLTDIRTAEENERDGMSMTKHPFFGDNYFKHAPLVPELTPDA